MEIFMEKKKENPNILILQDIYKSITLRSDMLTSLLEKTENHELKELLCAAIDTCEGFAGRAEQRLELLSVRAKEPGMLEKIPSEISVKASMLTECCTSKIAELVIEGAVSGVSEYKERIRDADQSGVALENIRLNNTEDIQIALGGAEQIPAFGTFDIVFANINRNILLNDIHHYNDCLKPGGLLYMSGFYLEDIPIIEEECKQNGLSLLSYTERNRWVAIKVQKQ
jgi:hypothetical protein